MRDGAIVGVYSDAMEAVVAWAGDESVDVVTNEFWHPGIVVDPTAKAAEAKPTDAEPTEPESEDVLLPGTLISAGAYPAPMHKALARRVQKMEPEEGPVSSVYRPHEERAAVVVWHSAVWDRLFGPQGRGGAQGAVQGRGTGHAQGHAEKGLF